MNLDTTKKQAKDCFYPFITNDNNATLEHFYKEFSESECRILLLIGPTGTGKSTFVRSWVSSQRKRALVAYEESVLQDPSLYQKAVEYDALVLEDADNLLRAREKGNPIMSGLLNMSDGVVRNETKVIISTNLPSLTNVDSALLRPGRCFAVLQFREPTTSEANVVAQEKGINPRDFSTQSTWTLSEILNNAITRNWSINRAKGSIGF
jgi:GTPase SAR1 family protein